MQDISAITADDGIGAITTVDFLARLASEDHIISRAARTLAAATIVVVVMAATPASTMIIIIVVIVTPAATVIVIIVVVTPASTVIIIIVVVASTVPVPVIIIIIIIVAMMSAATLALIIIIFRLVIAIDVDKDQVRAITIGIGDNRCIGAGQMDRGIRLAIIVGVDAHMSHAIGAAQRNITDVDQRVREGDDLVIFIIGNRIAIELGGGPGEGVVTRPTGQQIRAQAAFKDVVPGAARKRVVRHIRNDLSQ